MPKVRVTGWITPEGYQGQVLKGETPSRALRVDLTFESENPENDHLLMEAGNMAEAAQLVIDRWEKGDLASAVAGLDEALDSLRQATQRAVLQMLD